MKLNTILILFLIVLVAMPARAYIDPGSGSTIMSAIIGFIVAIGLVIKTYWYKIKRTITGKKSSVDKNN